MIDHGFDDDGVRIVTLYGHGSELVVPTGTFVEKGDIIMKIGSTRKFNRTTRTF